MARSATLSIRIVSDARQAAAGFAEAEDKVGKFTGGLDKASVVAGGALAGIVGIGKAAFDAASELQQAGGAVQSVFGPAAEAVNKQAAAAAQTVGLASSSYSNLAALLGSQLKGMGFAADELAPKSDELIKLGADLAATYGGTTADAVSALSSVLKGETDPIERYGVSLKQSDVNAKLAAMGASELEGQALKTATAQAALGLIADQTGSAVGAFGREADTAAGQTQRAQAEVENAKAALGEALLPIVAEAATKLSELAGIFATNKDGTAALVVVIASLAAGILLVRGAVAAYQAGVVVVTAAQWLWNAALTANPLGLIVVGVAALIAVVVLLYTKWDSVKSVLGWVWDKLKGIISLGKSVGEFVGSLFGSGGGGGGTPASAPVSAAVRMGASPSAVRMGAVMSSSGGRVGSSSGGQEQAPAGNTYITIQGAVDPVATSYQVQALLDERQRNIGSTGLRAGMGR